MKKFYSILAAMALTAGGFSASEAAAATATFYVLDASEEWSIENPYEQVTIFNLTAEEPVECNDTFFNFPFEEETTLKISPVDMDEYALVVSASDFNDPDFYTLSKDETEWTLVLTPGSSEDYEFQIFVYPKDEAPKDEAELVEVSFSISAADGVEISNPNECLTISYFDMENFESVNVDLSSTFASAEVISGTTFDLIPAEGYIITASSFSDNVAISEPSNPLAPWNVYISQGGSPAIISVEVSKAMSATVNFEGSMPNPQGLVTVTSEDKVVFNESSNSVYIPAEGLTFTVVPKKATDEDDPDYVISAYEVQDPEGTVLTSEQLSTYGVTIEGDQDNGYEVSLTEKANGVTITFTIAEKGNSAIISIDDKNADAVIYNLQGVRVNNPAKGGIYIINGKKVLVK